MILKVADHRQLAPVQGRIADPVYALIGLDLERYEITPGRADDDACRRDFHCRFPSSGVLPAKPTTAAVGTENGY